MPQWKEDVKIKAQFPDEHSKMTHPYTYVESRFGNCPHKTTVVEEWAKKLANWLLKGLLPVAWMYNPRRSVYTKG